MEKALQRLIRAAERTRRMDDTLMTCGYSNSPYADILDDISDAIYDLLNESTHRFEDSMTYIVLHTDAITEEAKVNLLLKEYRKNAMQKEPA